MIAANLLTPRSQTDLTLRMEETENAAWRKLPAKKRSTATQRELIVKTILEAEARGVSRNNAIDHLLAHLDADTAPDNIKAVALQLGRNGRPPNRSTIYNWMSAYDQGGVQSLISNHKGRARGEYGWELRAQQLYGKPSKPGMATVALWLRDEGFDSATDPRVRRYLKSLPENMGEHSPARLGPKLFRDTQKTYVERDTSVLDVGFIYQGDGHTVDVYVAHPATGNAWRPELTVWMDIRSRYIVGWYLTEAESGISTLLALSHAMLSHDHVPAMLHIDNGSGFKSKMMNAESTGFYDRFSIGVMFALPGNSKGKGQVERWFRTLEMQFGKRWDTFCGHGMSPESSMYYLRDVKAGKKQLPTFAQFKELLGQWIESYNNRVHSEIGCAPAELWNQLQHVAIELPATAVVRQRVKRTVQRTSVQLDNRRYINSELVALNGKTVIVEFDLHNDETVSVLNVADESWVCDATLTDKVPYLPASRIEEYQQRRVDGQRKRLQRKLDEVDARARGSIEAQTERTKALTDFELPALTNEPGETLDSLDSIDVLDTEY
jgi:putative transposase